LLTGQS
jgi:hypothetical protein